MAVSNHPDWTHVRIRRSTKERLEAHFRAKAAYYARTGRGLAVPAGSVSVNEAIEYLLDQEEDHKFRTAKANHKRRSKAQAEASSVGLPPLSPDGVRYVDPQACEGEANGKS